MHWIEDVIAASAAVRAEYPDLWRYLPRTPRNCREARGYAERAWRTAARRIPEAYGLGAGSEWLARYRPWMSGADVEDLAESQVLASLQRSRP